MNRTLRGLVLAAVVACAALLRFAELPARGLWYWDEATLLRSARFYSTFSGARASGSLSGDPRAAVALQQEARKGGGERTRTAKPAVDTLLAAADSLLGSRDLSGLLVSALAGTATVLALAAAPLPTPFSSASLAAAALLALSSWHLNYSRSALSQSVSLLAVTAVLAATLAALQPGRAGDGPRPSRLAAAGLLSGLAFTTHYNLFWLPVVTGLALTAAVVRRGSGLRGALPGVAWTWAPMAVAPAVFQAASLTPAAAGVAAPGYFDQVAFQLFWWNGRRSEWTGGPIEALEAVARTSSLPFLLLAAAGLLGLALRARRGDLSAGFLAAMGLVPILVWSAWGYVGPRSFAPALPAALLGAGVLLARLRPLGGMRAAEPPGSSGRLLPARLAGGAILGAALLAELPADRVLLSARSPWRETAREVRAIEAAGGPRLDPGSVGFYGAPLLGYYLGELSPAPAEGAPRLVVDDSLPGGGPRREALLAEARRTGRLVHQTDAGTTDGMIADEMFPSALGRALRAAGGGAKIRLWEWTPPQGGVPPGASPADRPATRSGGPRSGRASTP